MFWYWRNRRTKWELLTPTRSATIEDWFNYDGVETFGGLRILYKRVSADFKTQEGTERETVWPVGSTLSHPEWNPEADECSGGQFHGCSKPFFCDQYRHTENDRYIALSVSAGDMNFHKEGEHPHKIGFCVGTVLYECDRFGEKVEAK